MEEGQDSGDTLPPLTFKQWQIPTPSSESDPYSNSHVKASLLFELASVSITRDTFKELDVELGLPHVEIPSVTFYGYIRLTDDLGNEFYLFYRESDNPKTVSLRNQISVILPKCELESPRCLPKTFFLEFYLVDRHRKTVILDELKFFDCTRDDVGYDIGNQISYGPYDFSPHTVYVNFTIFQCALLAHVSFAVVKKENEEEDGGINALCVAEVSGVISATSKGRLKCCIDRVLFDNTLRKLDYGALIKLSTVAVPAYSSLEIQANLKVNGDEILVGNNGALVFEPRGWPNLPFEQEIMGQKCCIRVFVTWQHAVHCLPEYDSYEWRAADEASSEEIEDCFEETLSDERKSNNIERPPPQIKMSRIREKREFRSVDIKPRELLDLTKKRISRIHGVLVELFSISIRSDDGGDVSPHGDIWSCDSNGDYLIFDSDKQRPDIILHPDEPLPLLDLPRCYVGPLFGVSIGLKGGDGREISYGELEYDDRTVTPWLDRRMCPVIRGKHGFAAVHYSIFSDAVQAKLKFILLVQQSCSSASASASACCRVKGRINARYRNCRYSTHYEKKHYQSVLFKKSEFVDLDDGGEIPLSKSLVAVPRNASNLLVVIADIGVQVGGGNYVETLKCKAAFDPEIRSPSHTIEGSNYRLLVSVVWDRFN